MGGRSPHARCGATADGALDAAAEPYWGTHRQPVLPPLEDCLPAAPEPFPGFRVGHLDFVDSRLDPATVAWFSGQPAKPGRIAGYLQMKDAPTTTLDLLVLADAFPPVTFDLGVPGWVPTLELTVLVRGIPAPGPLRAEQTCELLQDGWLDEECVIWDSAGRLVCQARQLAGYRLG